VIPRTTHPGTLGDGSSDEQAAVPLVASTGAEGPRTTPDPSPSGPRTTPTDSLFASVASSLRFFFSHKCPVHRIRLVHMHTPFGPYGCLLCEKELRDAATRQVIAERMNTWSDVG